MANKFVVSDQNFEIYDQLDPTKRAKFELSAVASNTTQVITLPTTNGSMPAESTLTGTLVWGGVAAGQTSAYTLYKVGKMVVMEVGTVINKPQAANDSAVTATAIPVGYRPLNLYTSIGVVQVKDNLTFGYGTVYIEETNWSLEITGINGSLFSNVGNFSLGGAAGPMVFTWYSP